MISYRSIRFDTVPVLNGIRVYIYNIIYEYIYIARATTGQQVKQVPGTVVCGRTRGVRVGFLRELRS